MVMKPLKNKGKVFTSYCVYVLIMFVAVHDVAGQDSRDSAKQTFEVSCGVVRTGTQMLLRSVGARIEPTNGRLDTLSFSINRLKDSRGKRIAGKNFDKYMVPPPSHRVHFPWWIDDSPTRLIGLMH